jgi:hypothetical protein
MSLRSRLASKRIAPAVQMHIRRKQIAHASVTKHYSRIMWKFRGLCDRQSAFAAFTSKVVCLIIFFTTQAIAKHTVRFPHYEEQHNKDMDNVKYFNVLKNVALTCEA